MRRRALALGGCVLAASFALLSGPAAGQGPPAEMTVTPSQLAFGSVCVGRSSLKSFTIANKDGADQLQGISVQRSGSSAFNPASENFSALDGGKSTPFAVTFAPRSRGAASATYSFSSDNGGSATTSVTGTGRDRKLTASRASITFGDQRAGTRSPTQSLTLTNPGGDPVTVTALTRSGANGADFRASGPAATFTITPGAIAAVSVAFQPSGVGLRTGSLAIVYSNQWCSPATILVSLVGTGIVPNISLDPNPVNVGASPKGKPGKPVALTLSNDGKAALKITAIQVLGTDAGDFALTGLPVMPVTVPAAGTLVFSVRMTASEEGLRIATINVISDDPDTPAFSVPLRGTGGTASPTPTASPRPSSPIPSVRPTGKNSPQAIAEPGNDSLAVGMVVGGVLFAFGGLLVIRRLVAARDQD
jgi:trimeric autotransporter adhesin